MLPHAIRMSVLYEIPKNIVSNIFFWNSPMLIQEYCQWLTIKKVCKSYSIPVSSNLEEEEDNKKLHQTSFT